jgi:hypothetical protein
MLRANPLLLTFIIVAVVVRLAFWFYTQRVWEDSLITLTAARNVWEGHGLTHHASEPRVHSFTSPISVLIPLIGIPFHAGLAALRLSSLAGAVAAVYFAYRIGVLLNFHWAAQVLVLSYLSCDQLQIFFGMSGMETQVATAIGLGAIYFFAQKSWRSLGYCCGLASIARPEFVVFLLPLIGLALLFSFRSAIVTVAARALPFALGWFGFATLYYGSPIPHTIMAKSYRFQYGVLSAAWEVMWHFTLRSWRDYAPFREFWSVIRTPFPDIALQAIVVAMVVLFLSGWFVAIKRNAVVFLCGAIFVSFYVYRNVTVLNSYYMWYLPPFVALGFLVAGFGLSRLSRRLPKVGMVIGVAIGFAYAAHLPFSLPLDRKVQKRIEMPVRVTTGRILNELMTEKDTVVLEPLGLIGWEAFNKTIYDFPGLGSKIAERALQDPRHASLAGLVDALQPTFLCFRPTEVAKLERVFPETAAKYALVTTIRTPSQVRLSGLGYEYAVMDDEFRIFRRTRDFEAVVRP